MKLRGEEAVVPRPTCGTNATLDEKYFPNCGVKSEDDEIEKP